MEITKIPHGIIPAVKLFLSVSYAGIIRIRFMGSKYQIYFISAKVTQHPVIKFLLASMFSINDYLSFVNASIKYSGRSDANSRYSPVFGCIKPITFA
jgi:hypothetical protein